MNYLLDTNVISEMFRPQPHAAVRSWLTEQPESTLWLSAATWAELRFGAERLPPGRRRNALLEWMIEGLAARYYGRILPVDLPVAEMWGVVYARRAADGQAMNAMDGLIAATALVHGLTLATRNERDFAETTVPLFNPWG